MTICSAEVVEVLHRVNTDTGVAVRCIMRIEDIHVEAEALAREFPCGLLPNLLMNEILTVHIQFLDKETGESSIAYVLPWSNQPDKAKLKVFNTVIHHVGRAIGSIPWAEGESSQDQSGDIDALERIYRSSPDN